jgi:dihydroflavonol-4-reductase
MRRAFVTGATGFVGRNLVEKLVATNWDVTALVRDLQPAAIVLPRSVRTVIGSVTDRESVIAGMPSEVDAVFHIAGDTNLWSANNAAQTRVNVDGSRNVVEAALAKRARKLVATSSTAAFGFHDGRINEETPSSALTSNINYFRTKWLGEEAVRKGVREGLDATIINPGHIIGPYDTRNWSRMIAMVEQGKLPGVPPGGGSFCHVRSVVGSHIAAVDRGRAGHNYLLGGTDATFLEMVTIIGRLTGKKTPKRPVPAFALKALGRVNEWISFVTRREPDITPESAALVTKRVYCDCSKAERELGFTRVGLEEMLADCYAWMKSKRDPTS